MSPTMPSFPAEIWLLIRDALMEPWGYRRTLAHLCRTCKALRDFAEPALYGHCSFFLAVDKTTGDVKIFLRFYRTMLESPRLAAMVTYFLPSLDTGPEVDISDSVTDEEAEEIARLLQQTTRDRFGYPYDAGHVVNRKWGPLALVGLLPFLLPNLEEIMFLDAKHYAMFQAARRLHKCRRLPPLAALTTLFVGAHDKQPPCGDPDTLRLNSLRPYLELAPWLESFTLSGVQGHEPHGTGPDSHPDPRGEPALPKFPGNLQVLEIKYGHFEATELAHALSQCHSLRRFVYSDGGIETYEPDPIDSYRGITPGQVVEALRPTARHTLETLALESLCYISLQHDYATGPPRLIRGGLRDFPRLRRLDIVSDVAFWTFVGPRPTATNGRRLLDLLPEPSLETLHLRCFDPVLVPDLRRLARAVADEARFPRLRVVRVGVASEDAEDPAEESIPKDWSRERWYELVPPYARLGRAVKADIAEDFGRGGVEVVFQPGWKWAKPCRAKGERLGD